VPSSWILSLPDTKVPDAGGFAKAPPIVSAFAAPGATSKTYVSPLPRPELPPPRPISVSLPSPPSSVSL
jgi:hypothetical protein